MRKLAKPAWLCLKGAAWPQRTDRVTGLPGGRRSGRAGQTLAHRHRGDPAGTGEEKGGDSGQRVEGEERLAATPPAVRPLPLSSEQRLRFMAHSRVSTVVRGCSAGTWLPSAITGSNAPQAGMNPQLLTVCTVYNQISQLGTLYFNHDNDITLLLILFLLNCPCDSFTGIESGRGPRIWWCAPARVIYLGFNASYGAFLHNEIQILFH